MTSVKWNDDVGTLFALARRELFTAVVGDIMDKLGFLHQFLPPRIRPLRPDMVVIGRAMTVLEADVFEERYILGKQSCHGAALRLDVRGVG